MPYNNKMRSGALIRLFRRSYGFSPTIRLACMLVCYATLVCAQPAPPPQRIVSLNLCADQLLQALAEPQHILGLSPLARDKALSLYAAEAAHYRSVAPKSEILLELKPDLVLLAPAGQELLRARLLEDGIPVLTVKGWNTLEDGDVQIRELALRLGRQDQGEALIGKIRQALQQSLQKPLDRHRTVLEIERRLYTPGRSSLIASLLQYWQIPNRADQPDLQQGGFIALERLLLLNPDRLIVSNGNDGGSDPQGGDDMGLALLRHPALRHSTLNMIDIPARLTLCGGPATITLIETLSDALR